MAKKYYAVRVGLIPGIYETWDECKQLVLGYQKAEYKSFSSYEEADDYMNYRTPSVPVTKTTKQKKITKNEDLKLPPIFAFVDGSYNEATNVYGYGGYISINGEKHILQGCSSDDLASMRNVAGEVKGSMAAMEFAVAHDLKNLCILYDYTGIEMWATGKWKRNKKGTIAYHEYYQSIKDKINIEFRHVKGHAGIEGNEDADKLAKKAVGIIKK